MTITLRTVNAFRSGNLINRWHEVDPFINATPCWQLHIYSMLPPETIKTTDREDYNKMAIKVLPEAQAPDRMYKKGIISSKKDYNEVQLALRDMKVGQALIVSMDQNDWQGVKKPETTFSASLRRYFESKGLQCTAYQSAKWEVTIRKATALDHSKKKKRA
jgi:hypothetical protein